MKTKTNIISALAVTGALPLLFTSCEIEKTQDMKMPEVNVDAEAGELPDVDVVVKDKGELPKVDVDVESGKLPKFDVDGPDVDVSIEKKTVEIPVPKVDVDLPNDKPGVAGE